MASKRPSTKRKAVNRRNSALALKEERDNRTPQEQLDILDKRLGVGMGAVKERARLREQLTKK